MATRTDFLCVEEGLTTIQYMNTGVIHSESSSQPHKGKRVETIEGNEISDSDDADNDDDYNDDNNNNNGGKNLTKDYYGCKNMSA